jgi:hypothetical protein
MKNKSKPVVRKPAPLPSVSADEALAYAEKTPPPALAPDLGAPSDTFPDKKPRERLPPPPSPGQNLQPALTPSDKEAARVARIGKVPSGDVRLSINVSAELHMRLKLHAVRERVTVGELVERWIRTNTAEA